MGQKTDRLNHRELRSEITDQPRHIDLGREEDFEQGDEIQIQRRAIEETRDQMTKTVDAIGHKLDPGRLMAQAKDTVVETTAEIHDKIDPEQLLRKAHDTIVEATRDALDLIHDATVGRMQNAVGHAVQRGKAVVGNVTDSALGAPSTLMSRIKEHPLPAALAGIGLYLLFTGKPGVRRTFLAEDRTERYHEQDTIQLTGSGSDNFHPASPSLGNRLSAFEEKVGDVASHATGAVFDAARQARTKVGDAASQARSKIGDVASQVGDVASQARSKIEDMASQVGDAASQARSKIEDAAIHLKDNLDFGALMRSNPLSMAMAIAATGAVLGFLIPETERENALMGEARASILEKAQATAADVVGQVQEKASDLMTKLAGDEQASPSSEETNFHPQVIPLRQGDAFVGPTHSIDLEGDIKPRPIL